MEKTPPLKSALGFWGRLGGGFPSFARRNSTRAVKFFKAAFGAIEVFRMDGGDGSVVCRLSIAGYDFWVNDESPENGNFSPQTLNGSTTRFIMSVPDPDAGFARAVAAGAKEIMPVKNGYGWRVGRIVDPFGHHWEIGRLLEE